MWRGYLKNDDGRLVQQWFDDGGTRAAHLHTSGHASPVDLRASPTAFRRGGSCPFMGLPGTLKRKVFPVLAALQTANQ